MLKVREIAYGFDGPSENNVSTPVTRISGKIEKTVNLLEVAHKLMT